ncbi:hypothetical protein P692DRAFT_20833025 [Suillus brevipes Sb2]|nr:hypothetical protein P692DRAFT_20833025 [Suillus brevipes Sb2]
MLHTLSPFFRAVQELLQGNSFRSTVILVGSRNRSLDPGLKVAQITVDLLQVGTTRSPPTFPSVCLLPTGWLWNSAMEALRLHSATTRGEIGFEIANSVLTSQVSGY